MIQLKNLNIIMGNKDTISFCFSRDGDSLKNNSQYLISYNFIDQEKPRTFPEVLKGSRIFYIFIEFLKEIQEPIPKYKIKHNFAKVSRIFSQEIRIIFWKAGRL